MPGPTLEIDADTQRRLEAIAQELTREFAGVSSEIVRGQVQRVSGQLIQTASFLDFVPLLTRRLVREELESLTVSQAVAVPRGPGRAGGPAHTADDPF